MRVLLIATLFLVVAGPASAHSPCNPPGSKTIRQTPLVRVYSAPGRYGRDVLACLHGAARPYRLGLRDRYMHGVSPVRIRGRLVAWSPYRSDRYGRWSTGVFVADLRTRRITARWSRDGYSAGCDGEVVEYVTGLALAPSGSVAWIDDHAGCFGTHRREVVTLSDGQRTTLDDAPEVHARYLRWSFGELLWRHGGEYRSAPLR